MRSYTDGRNIAGTWTKNTATANLTYLDSVANADYRRICAMKDWPFLQKLRTLSTTASTQFMNLPYDCDLVRAVSVVPTGSTIRYTPKLVADRRYWDQLNLRSYVSDIPEFAYVYAGQIGLWPVPASTSNTVSLAQKCRVIDLSVADITSTTVTSIASGGTSMVVSGGVSALMAGMWIRVTYTPGTTNTGDGLWYEISSVSGSTITLVRAYGGTTISAGTAACTIGQMSLLPEAFQDMPWIWAAGTYWRKEDDNRAASFFEEHGSYTNPPTGMVRELVAAYSEQDMDMVIDGGDDDTPINPNLLVTL